MDQRSLPLSSSSTTRNDSRQRGVQENVGVVPGVTSRVTGPAHSGSSSGPTSSEQPSSQTSARAASGFERRTSLSLTPPPRQEFVGGSRYGSRLERTWPRHPARRRARSRARAAPDRR